MRIDAHKDLHSEQGAQRGEHPGPLAESPDQSP